MPRYPDTAKEQIRDAVDFVDLVGTRTELRRAGSGRYEGLCPFHDERSPSFGIDPGQKVYHCFGCGVGGDVFTFVQETEGLDFVGAMEYLADRYGVHLEPVAEDPQAAAARQRSDRLFALLDRTAGFYARYLWASGEAAPAREYLAERGLSEEALRTYRVGYSPSRFDVVLNASRKAGFTNRELYDAGVAQRSKSGPLIDRFRRRIMFPLADRRGRVMGFGARALGPDQQPKYLNSSDSDVFRKGRHVYGSDVARAAATKAGAVILAEGYTDVVALHQAGLRNVVGLMGTALTEEQVTELARLAPVVQLALDADDAGQNAILRAAKVAAGKKVQLRVVALPPGDDPADVVRAGGGDRVRALVDASVPFVQFRVERALAQADLASAEGKDAVIAELRPVFEDLPAGAMREELLALVADRTDLKPSLVAGWLAGAGRPASGPSSPGRAAAPAAPTPLAAARAGSPLARAELEFLAVCVAQPRPGAVALGGDLDALFATPLHRQAAEHLREHLDAPVSGLDEQSQLAAFLGQVSVRAGQAAQTQAGFEAEHLKLRLARIAHEQQHVTGTSGRAALGRERARLQVDLGRALERVEQSQAG